jgi:hypothetical protein
MLFLVTVSIYCGYKIGELNGEIRRAIEGITTPQDIKEEITRHLSRLGTVKIEIGKVCSFSMASLPVCILSRA